MPVRPLSGLVLLAALAVGSARAETRIAFDPAPLAARLARVAGR